MTARVVVTGLGVISSAGPDAAALLAAVTAGRCCLAAVQDPRYRPALRVMAGLVAAVPAAAPGMPAGWPKPDRFVDLALAAAGQALRQARIDPAGLGCRMAAILGTCSGPTTLLEEHYRAALNGTPDRSPAQAFRLAYESAVRTVARAFGVGGFTGTVTTACSAGLMAIGTGADLIRSGLCDAVLAGGADAYNLSTQLGFDGLKAPSDGPCAPFSKPVGLCLGEGSAFLVLERLDCAQARGAAILAEILGFGTSNDAHHCSAPDPSGQGQSLAVLRALENAGLARESVAYINAHGTGTLANDKAETKAIRRVFGPDAAHMPVSSQKAVFGHMLGAAGAVESAVTLLCHQAGTLPPTANFAGGREGCDLDYVAEPGRPFPQERPWLKESFAFGGHNAALVMGPLAPAAGPAGGRQPRVCIAGMGLVTSAGAGRAAFGQLLAGSGPALRDCAPPGHAPIRAALVPDVLDPALARRLGLQRMDKAGSMGTVAAHQALLDAGLALRPEVVTSVGLFLGHASGSNAAEAAFLPDLLSHDYVIQRIAEFTLVVPNATAGAICRALGLRGHNAAFCFGEGAGLMSLVAGASAMANRHVPFLLAGAVDVLTERGWGHPLPGSAPPPTEGAVFFLLEAEDHLRARGGRALAVIDGLAVATDALADWDARPADPVARAVAAAALAQAGLAPDHLAPAPDVAARVGAAEACGPLFNIAAGILAGGRDPGLDRPLLSSISSRQGVSASVVLGAFGMDRENMVERETHDAT